MPFTLTEKEKESTLALTNAAYNSHVLVNDYFSWDKEWQNYQANGSKGEITSAVFLFMKWYSVGPQEGKAMLKSEIMKREQMFCDAKAAFLAQGVVSDSTDKWLSILDLVTGGNFVWSMTTARYIVGADDGYPRLRAEHQRKLALGAVHDFSAPIGPDLQEAKRVSFDITDDHSSDSHVATSESTSTAPTSPSSSSSEPALKRKNVEEPATAPVLWTELYEGVGSPSSFDFKAQSTNWCSRQF